MIAISDNNSMAATLTPLNTGAVLKKGAQISDCLRSSSTMIRLGVDRKEAISNLFKHTSPGRKYASTSHYKALLPRPMGNH